MSDEKKTTVMIGAPDARRSALVAAVAALAAGDLPVMLRPADPPPSLFLGARRGGKTRSQATPSRGTRVEIDRHAAKQLRETQGADHILTKTGDGITYRYGTDGVLHRVTPKGGRNKKERRANRDRVRALIARQQDKDEFNREE